jgi:hypothetical protein
MLNDAQKRSLSTTLRVLEEMLNEAEWILTMGGYSRIMYEVTHDSAPSAKDKVLETMSHIKEKIKSLAEQFDLEHKVQQANRKVSANLLYCWEILEGAKTDRLRGYGKIEDGLKELLDPQLDSLIELIRELIREF